MNVVGRRIGKHNSTAHHQRQHSDDFIRSAFNGKCLQSSDVRSSQEFEIYGGKRVSKKSPEPAALPISSRSFSLRMNGDKSVSPEPAAAAPPISSRSMSLRMNGDKYVAYSELSPSLMDLYSFDTVLLPEAYNIYEGYGLHKSAQGKSFNDFEPYQSTDRFSNRARGMAENNVLKSISVDKERANNVAKIKVVVRKRPLNKKEVAKKEEDIITILSNSNALTVHEKKLKVDLTEYVEKHEFLFDAVLNEDVSNEKVYSESVEPIVPLIFNRTKATCFAYGQTGSGKTYTMQPLPLKASQDILRLMYHSYRNQGFQLFVSFFEIYGGKVFDLLNDRRKLFMREDGKQQVCIVGLQEYKVLDVETIKGLAESGNAARGTGTTGANEESSRSHAILQLAIKRSADGSEKKPAKLVGKLSFIDLAGSERGADTTDNDKQTRMEGAEINKSLLALKECIRALDNDQGHIPFRGSKLTEVLRDSFVGDSRTVMISCISPSSGSCEHTLNTLRYADRVKSLSKGNNAAKKDSLSSSSNLRDSTALPLASSLPTDSFEDIIPDNKPRWSDRIERDTSPFKVDRVPSGRVEGNVSVAYPDYYMGQKSGLNRMAEDNLDHSEETNSDDDLSALLKEEEDLVSAHRRQVEDTMEIVREEMNLLVEADQPGNQLDNYISKLNTILSQKAAGIVQLQARLDQFQKHLKEYNVLVSSGN
uniref:Kinesin-like protein n=1 Tax=Gossypium hirsutum TaxID=3635 RepID=A0A0C5IA86_GOSHI|nr:kinesin-13A-like [Gossypium hirsutum]AJP36636.1 KIS13B4 [Gossypium hirsutum]